MKGLINNITPLSIGFLFNKYWCFQPNSTLNILWFNKDWCFHPKSILNRILLNKGNFLQPYYTLDIIYPIKYQYKEIS